MKGSVRKGGREEGWRRLRDGKVIGAYSHGLDVQLQGGFRDGVWVLYPLVDHGCSGGGGGGGGW